MEAAMHYLTQAGRKIGKNKFLYIMLVPMVLYYVLFHYMPMYGAQIAFRDYLPSIGIWESPWVGMTYFKQFFNSVYFGRLMRNTLLINLYDLLVGFTFTVALALLINEVTSRRYKKFVQTVLYMPHFISVVVLAGLVVSFLSPSGPINNLIRMLGGETIRFMQEKTWYRTIFVFSGIWQDAGWGTIVYLAALTNIDISLYEAAIADGASRFKRMLYITIPCIMPTVIVMLILRMGNIFTVGFEKTMLLYNELTYETADVIATYVYRRGIIGAEYSFSTAVGLYNSVLNLATIVIFNAISKKANDIGLW
jgi:putative aldouronate transport system permease protein